MANQANWGQSQEEFAGDSGIDTRDAEAERREQAELDGQAAQQQADAASQAARNAAIEQQRMQTEMDGKFGRKPQAAFTGEPGRVRQTKFTGKTGVQPRGPLSEQLLRESQTRLSEKRRPQRKQAEFTGKAGEPASRKQADFTGKAGKQPKQAFTGAPGQAEAAARQESQRVLAGKQPKQGFVGQSDENTDKNQTSLALGSEGYKERLRDKAGIEEENFVGERALASGGPVGHAKAAEGARKESDKFQADLKKVEPDHVQELAGQLGQAAQLQRDADQAVAVRKYRNRMAKMDQYPDVIKAMEVHAEHTETMDDDKAVEKLKGRDVSDMPEIVDDGITVEDFMGRSFNKYM